METPTRKLHPLVLTASVAVIVLAITGVAAFTGLLPGIRSAPSDVQAPAPAVEAQQPAPAGEVPTTNPARKHVAKARNPMQVAVTQPEKVVEVKPACANCGVIESVREVEVKGAGTGVGAVAGGVIGAVVGHQLGGGNAKTLLSVVGAAGGAYAGNEVEKKERATKHWEVAVHLEDGRTQVVSLPEQPSWRVGDRVRIINGTLEPISG